LDACYWVDANCNLVGDYSIFIDKWADPHGGIHGYLHRFLESGDSTFQHIAIWTLLQLLESEDEGLIQKIRQSDEVVNMVKSTADREIQSDEEGDEDGEGEVIALARRCADFLSPPKGLNEG
jgi:vacuolar protein 8